MSQAGSPGTTLDQGGWLIGSEPSIRRLHLDLQACQTLLCPASCKGSHKHEAVLLHPWATAGAPRLSEPCGSGVVAFSFARTAWRSGWLLHANGLQRITWKLEISGGNQNCTFWVNKQLLPGRSSFYAIKHVK